MKSFSKFALLAALLAGSFGCATTTYRSLGLPPEQVAVVHGSASNLRLIGTDERVQFLELDGEHLYRGSSQGYPTKLDVLPGRHKLLIGYSIYVDSSFHERGELSLDANLEAGKEYHVDLVHEGTDGWRAALVEAPVKRELTEAEQREAAAKRFD